MELDVQSRAFLDAGKASGQPPFHELEIADIRRAIKQLLEATAIPREEVARCKDILVPGPNGEIPVRIYWPRIGENADLLPILIFFHGGGGVSGDLDDEDHVCRYYCNAAEAVVFNIDYRLAPENKFPAGVEDCYAATQWIAGNTEEFGIDGARLAVTGDSAGGNLAAAVCQISKDRDGPEILYQALIYPVLSFTEDADSQYVSRNKLGTGEFFIGLREIAQLRELYLEQIGDAEDWRASPILADDLAGLPPALIITAGFDPLRDEGKHYADRLADAGVAVEYRCFETTFHGFLTSAGALDVGWNGLELVADRVRAALAQES